MGEEGVMTAASHQRRLDSEVRLLGQYAHAESFAWIEELVLTYFYPLGHSLCEGDILATCN